MNKIINSSVYKSSPCDPWISHCYDGVSVSASTNFQTDDLGVGFNIIENARCSSWVLTEYALSIAICFAAAVIRIGIDVTSWKTQAVSVDFAELVRSTRRRTNGCNKETEQWLLSSILLIIDIHAAVRVRNRRAYRVYVYSVYFDMLCINLFSIIILCRVMYLELHAWIVDWFLFYW